MNNNSFIYIYWLVVLIYYRFIHLEHFHLFILIQSLCFHMFTLFIMNGFIGLIIHSVLYIFHEVYLCLYEYCANIHIKAMKYQLHIHHRHCLFEIIWLIKRVTAWIKFHLQLATVEWWSLIDQFSVLFFYALK